jgi:hypothetical protein
MPSARAATFKRTSRRLLLILLQPMPSPLKLWSAEAAILPSGRSSEVKWYSSTSIKQHRSTTYCSCVRCDLPADEAHLSWPHAWNTIMANADSSETKLTAYAFEVRGVRTTDQLRLVAEGRTFAMKVESVRKYLMESYTLVQLQQVSIPVFSISSSLFSHLNTRSDTIEALTALTGLPFLRRRQLHSRADT